MRYEIAIYMQVW